MCAWFWSRCSSYTSWTSSRTRRIAHSVGTFLFMQIHISLLFSLYSTMQKRGCVYCGSTLAGRWYGTATTKLHRLCVFRSKFTSLQTCAQTRKGCFLPGRDKRNWINNFLVKVHALKPSCRLHNLMKSHFTVVMVRVIFSFLTKERKYNWRNESATVTERMNACTIPLHVFRS